MKNNNALISTAMLTAIFEEKKQDTISLIIPFIINIIYNDPKISYEDIVKKMQEDYSFNNFPQAIIRIIINRLKSQKILKQENYEYIFISDVSKIVKEFNERREKSKKEIDTVINSLNEFFKQHMALKMSYLDCRNSFAKFLDKNGYLLYENIDNSTRLSKYNDKINYNIGLFINEHKLAKDLIFDYLKNIIEGSLIANALYVNIENNNNTDLNKLTCYFDTPFMLRVLEFKEPEYNTSALELVKLLKEQKVKIKCFKHNYNEIENIVEEYIRNYGKTQDKTLENFVIKDYSLTEVREILDNLEDLFKNLEIEIVDTPEYKKEQYKDIIDEKRLAENLKAVYKDEKVSYKTIDNDVASISAIMRLRKGKDYRKLEDCPAIFVTTNKDVRRETNLLLNLNETFKISPAISDIDLTAIVWLKSLVSNKDLPEIKLTENAMAAIKPTDSIRKKFNSTLVNLKQSKIDVSPSTLYNLLCSNYFVEKLMLNVEGDVNKINPNILLSTYESTLKENEILDKNEKTLKADNDRLIQRLLEKESEDKLYKENVYSKYKKIEIRIQRVILLLEKIIQIGGCFSLCIFSFMYTKEENFSITFTNILFYILSFYAILATFFPVSIFSLFKLIIDKININLFPFINKKINLKAEKTINEIFKK